MDIKELRGKLGNISQAELAYMLGVAVTTISRWENNKARPTKAIVRQLNRLARKAK